MFFIFLYIIVVWDHSHGRGLLGWALLPASQPAVCALACRQPAVSNRAAVGRSDSSQLPPASPAKAVTTRPSVFCGTSLVPTRRVSVLYGHTESRMRRL
eukprot:365349-Chlamydomonas_euryale.AAC.12